MYTTKTAVSPLSPVPYGTSVTFTATVTSNGKATPGGSVNFMDGTTLLGTQTLNASGVTTLSIVTLAGGSHGITATYAGNSNFMPSTSPALVQVVNPDTTKSTLSPLSPACYGTSV